MSWEDVDKSFDRTRPEDIVIHLALERFGELVGRVCSELCRVRGIEEFDVHSDEAKHMCIDAWRYVCHMADRAEFVASAQADLEKLDELLNTSTGESQGDVQPEHLPEFGGAARPPLGFEPPV